MTERDPTLRQLNVFINYRRADSRADAGRLYDFLVEHLDEEHVFIDIDSISPGRDFVEVIDETIERADILLVVIGPTWTTISNEAGAPRLDDENDYVRLEIQRALERGLRVLPVLVGGAPMPAARDLPTEIRPLTRRHAITLTDHRWRSCANEMLEALERIKSGTPIPAAPIPTAPIPTAPIPTAPLDDTKPRAETLDLTRDPELDETRDQREHTTRSDELVTADSTLVSPQAALANSGDPAAIDDAISPLPPVITEHDRPQPPTELASVVNPPETEGLSRRSRRGVIIAAIAVVVAIALAVGALVAFTGGTKSKDAAKPPGELPSELRFAAENAGDRTKVERTWTLGGDHGSLLKGQLLFTMSKGADPTTDEVFPKTLAKTSKSVKLTYKKSDFTLVKWIKSDPVLRIVPKVRVGTARITYEIKVPPDGIDQKRLAKWQKDERGEHTAWVKEKNATTALDILSPPYDAPLSVPTAQFVGTTRAGNKVRLVGTTTTADGPLLGGHDVPVDKKGGWATPVPLSPGPNWVKFEATAPIGAPHSVLTVVYYNAPATPGGVSTRGGNGGGTGGNNPGPSPGPIPGPSPTGPVVTTPATGGTTPNHPNRAPIAWRTCYTSVPYNNWNVAYVIDKGVGCISDPDGDAMTITSAGPSSTYGGVVYPTHYNGHAGTYYQPPNFPSSTWSGTDYYYFTVTDSHGASTRFTFRIDVEQQSPIQQ